MPVYTYVCDNCGVRFERHQKFSDKPLIRCPECAEISLRKVFTPVGIVFKGSGFYATDHRSSLGVSHKNVSAKSDSDNKPKKVDEGTDKKASTKKKNDSS
jgi:putative FmdB family regulatory protein